MALNTLLATTVKVFPAARNMCVAQSTFSLLSFGKICGRVASRSYSTVRLSYNSEGEDRQSGVPIIILHGILGSKANFRAIGKALSTRLDRPVYSLDARNHGSSPWTEEISYEAMSDDVSAFMDEKRMDSCCLVGHSMGGKTAMVTALRYPHLVEKLVVVDSAPVMSPGAGTGVAAHLNVLTSMQLNSADMANRKQVESRLEEAVPEKAVRDFLLTNLLSGKGGLYWRANLEIIQENLLRILSFPNLYNSYNGPTLFIGGKRSDYIQEEEHVAISRFFPQARIKMLDTGHWVHAEKPAEFMNLVASFTIDNVQHAAATA